MATKKEKAKDKDIIQAAKDCLEAHQEREGDNINRAKEAIRFRAGEQWPDAIRRDRENPHQEGGSRPCPVMDKTDQYIRQIINEERLNRAAIKIRPAAGGADPKTAEIFTGLIRHIEDASEAVDAYTLAGEHAADGGFGYFRLITEYCDPLSFTQDIKIRRIHNRFSVAPGYHTEIDGSDMEECVVYEDMTEDQFKKQYPDAKVVDFDGNDDWSEKDMVRVAEYFYTERTPMTIYQMDNGEVLKESDYNKLKELAEAQGIDVPDPVDERESVETQIKWVKCTSEEILDRKDIPGQWIPVVKVVGTEITMPDGKIRTSGAIEPAMDAQRLHNFSVAGYIEHVALAPRAPWVAEEGQVEGYEDDYAAANRQPISVLKYKAISEEGHLLPMPQRLPAEGIPMGWQGMLQNTEQGVMASFGMYGAQVGAPGMEKSGIALQEQKTQGAIGNFHYPDNLARSIQHCGRILVEWIPVYMDTAEVARILGEDGEETEIRLDPEMEQAYGQLKDDFGRVVAPIYNLKVGKYDVRVSTGASYTSKRQEAVETQTQIVQAAPQLMEVMGDILFANMDTPGAEEISKRLKMLLPPAIQQMEQAEEAIDDPAIIQAMQQIERQRQELEQRGMQIMAYEQEVKALANDANADKAKLDAARTELQAEKRVFMADVKSQELKHELQTLKIKEQIEDMLEAAEDELTKETLEAAKLDNERQIADRKLKIEEKKYELEREPRDDAIQAALQTLDDQIKSMAEMAAKPKSIKIERDENGEIVMANGQKVIRDENGNMIGLGDD